MPLYNSVQQGTGGCKHCGKRQSALTRTTSEAKAEEFMRQAGAEPLEPFPGAMRPWRCRHVPCGRVITPSLQNARRQGVCVYCAGNAVDVAEAIARMQVAGAEPQVDFPGSNVPWKCRCTRCERVTSPRYASILAGQTACRYCAGRAVVPTEAVELMRRARLEPTVPFPGADTPWLCTCVACGHLVSPVYNSVRRGRSGCVYCSHRRVDPKEAASVMLEGGLQPLEPYKSSASPWRCKCPTCGRTVSPAYSGIRGGQGGCVHGAPGRLTLTEPALVYLVVSEAWRAVKVGVAAEHSTRLWEHARHGWKPVDRFERPSVWLVPRGAQALDLEAALLRKWRAEGAPRALGAKDMPQRGFTETAHLAQIDLDFAVAWLDQAVAALWEDL